MRAAASRSWRLAVPLVAALAGSLFAVSATTAGGTDLRRDDTDLPSLIRDQAGTVDHRTQEAAALREEVTEGLDALPAGRELTQWRDRAGMLGAQAGLVPVEGPAVRVSLSDAGVSADALPDGVSVDDVVVHQQDVQAVVNALWASGAEAMTIQDQRVITTSAVRCVGNTLILHGRVYSPPFVVTAIGDQAALQRGLDEDPTVALYREDAAQLGLGYVVTHLDAVFPGYTSTTDLTYATAAR